MLELVLRVVFSLSVVLGLLWLIARVSSRRMRGSSHHSLMRTLARQPLARGSALAVVAVGERVLVVGVTEHQVNLLTELDPGEVDLAAAGANVTGLPSAEPGAAGATRAERSALPHPGETTGPLGGSALSAQTWKQAFAAATKRHGGGS